MRISVLLYLDELRIFRKAGIRASLMCIFTNFTTDSRLLLVISIHTIFPYPSLGTQVLQILIETIMENSRTFRPILVT